MNQTINQLRQGFAVRVNWTTPELKHYLANLQGEDCEAINWILDRINKTSRTLWTKRDLEELLNSLENTSSSVSHNFDDIELLLGEAIPTELILDITSNVSDPHLLFSALDMNLNQIFYIRSSSDIERLEDHLIAQNIKQNGREVAFIFLKEGMDEELGEKTLTKTIAGITSKYCANRVYLELSKERFPSNAFFVVVSGAVSKKGYFKDTDLESAYTAYVTDAVLDVFNEPSVNLPTPDQIKKADSDS